MLAPDCLAREIPGDVRITITQQHRNGHAEADGEEMRREVVLELFLAKQDLLDLGTAAAAYLARQGDGGIAGLGLQPLIFAAERQVLFDRQALACFMAKAWLHGVEPGPRARYIVAQRLRRMFGEVGHYTVSKICCPSTSR